MKRIALSFGLLLGATFAAQAQCVGVGGVNNAPYPGMNCGMEPTVTTYVAMGYGIAPAASATDVACITGSATKVTRVQRVKVSGTAGTLVTLPVLLTKHTATYYLVAQDTFTVDTNGGYGQLSCRRAA